MFAENGAALQIYCPHESKVSGGTDIRFDSDLRSSRKFDGFTTPGSSPSRCFSTDAGSSGGPTADSRYIGDGRAASERNDRRVVRLPPAVAHPQEPIDRKQEPADQQKNPADGRDDPQPTLFGQTEQKQTSGEQHNPGKHRRAAPSSQSRVWAMPPVYGDSQYRDRMPKLILHGGVESSHQICRQFSLQAVSAESAHRDPDETADRGQQHESVRAAESQFAFGLHSVVVFTTRRRQPATGYGRFRPSISVGAPARRIGSADRGAKDLFAPRKEPPEMIVNPCRQPDEEDNGNADQEIVIAVEIRVNGQQRQSDREENIHVESPTTAKCSVISTLAISVTAQPTAVGEYATGPYGSIVPAVRRPVCTRLIRRNGDQQSGHCCAAARKSAGTHRLGVSLSGRVGSHRMPSQSAGSK